MEIRQCNSANDVATAGANFINARVKESISERGQFTIALSGGSTPWMMLRELAKHDLPWQQVQIFQVDERVVPDGDAERNLVHIQKNFTARITMPLENLHAMPVTGNQLEDDAWRYDTELREIAGIPPILDVVHLGLGEDGHTASLVPDDPILQVEDRDVAITGTYSGRQRMTLTYSIINRARHILWLITGDAKTSMLDRMIQGDRRIPAGRVSQRQATVVADTAALSGIRLL